MIKFYSEKLTNLETAIDELEMECCHLTGKFDFLLKIAVRDMDEYNELLWHKLAKLPKVDNMESMFVISQAKSGTAVPFGERSPRTKSSA